MLTLTDLPQPDLALKRFEVTGFRDHNFSDHTERLLMLKGPDGDDLFLLVREEGAQGLFFFRPLARSEYRLMFRLENLAALQDEGIGTELYRQKELEDFENWTAPFYVLGNAPKWIDIDMPSGKRGHFVSGGGEAYRYYLEDDTIRRVVIMNVFRTGKTEVFVGIVHPDTVVDRIIGHE